MKRQAPGSTPWEVMRRHIDGPPPVLDIKPVPNAPPESMYTEPSADAPCPPMEWQWYECECGEWHEVCVWKNPEAQLPSSPRGRRWLAWLSLEGGAHADYRREFLGQLRYWRAGRPAFGKQARCLDAWIRAVEES